MNSIKELKQKYWNKIDLSDLELIISRVIKKPREFILAHPEYEIVESQEVHKVKSQMKKRIDGEPLAYIFGEKEFYGLNFKVNKNVLVPRPETEMMVEEAFRLATCNSELVTLIDVGTGSGCVTIALAKKLKSYKLIAIDISRPALKIARQNAKLHQVDKQIKFLHGNLLEPVIKKIKNKKLEIRNYNLVILANLPYLTPSQIKKSPSIKHEPKLALDAGKDGLKYYRELFKQIKNYKLSARGGSASGGQAKLYVLCEIDPSQTSKMKKIIKKNLPNAKTEIKKDLSGRDRLIITAV